MPIALSRFVSSNRSVTNAWSRPRSPRNVSSVRGSRPSPSAKFWRSIEVERGRRPLVRLGGSRQEPVELAPDRIDVDRDASVLEREQADPEGPLDDRRAVRRRALREEPGEPRVGQHEPLDDDPVAVEADRRLDGRGRLDGPAASDAENGMTVAFMPRSWSGAVPPCLSRPSAGPGQDPGRTGPAHPTTPVPRSPPGALSHGTAIRSASTPYGGHPPESALIIGSRESSTPASESASQMSAQPILLVIGIAIAVNLVIMGGLVVTLVARRRSRFATPDGLVEPAPYRSAAMTASPPTATSAVSFIDDADETDEIRPSRRGLRRRRECHRTSRLPTIPPGDVRRGRAGRGDHRVVPDRRLHRPAAGPRRRPSHRRRPDARPVRPGSRPTPVASVPTHPATAPATGPSRLDWEVRLRDEEARYARYRRPVSIVLVEVDGMERLVQRLGPDAAERIVPPIGQTLMRQARAADHVARIGLSRFAVLLPETDEIQAINYVERVQERVRPLAGRRCGGDCAWRSAGRARLRAATCARQPGSPRTA